MKYGVVYYKDTDNIGDDIQSYAVFRQMPQVDYLIDREHLDSFASKEVVAVVLNGWFLHNKYNWPPSKNIYPCCLSMHFTPNDYMNIGYDYLDGIGAEYLRNFQPIGCRDQSTFDVLQKKGIESYLSGCVTLTLEQRKRSENKEKYICMVDIPKEAQNKINEQADAAGFSAKSMTHWVDYKNRPIEWTERVERVEEILDLYQNAHCVVTKRLHCALPCLAMKTPVLLLLDSEQDDMTRYSHFTELLHVTSTKAFVEGRCEYSVICPPENKKDYVIERENLIFRIGTFLDESRQKSLPEKYLNWQRKDVIQILNWQKELAGSAAKTAADQVSDLLVQRGEEEKKTWDRINELSNKYEADMYRVQKYLQDKEIEIERLNHVIELKEQEEKRLNSVVTDKEQEEKRLNSVVTDKEQEEKRLNKVIADKEQEEIRLNSVVLEKDGEIKRLNHFISEKQDEMEYMTDKLNAFNQKVRNNEGTSILWLLFFSAEFKKKSLRKKCKIFLDALKNREKRSRIGLNEGGNVL